MTGKEKTTNFKFIFDTFNKRQKRLKCKKRAAYELSAPIDW